jgi:hypothetical protein
MYDDAQKGNVICHITIFSEMILKFKLINNILTNQVYNNLK